MDTSGKGGILRHAVGLVDPQGVHIKAFKAPTQAELRHDFLWRVERELPRPGDDRRLRPLALRGRADRPGPRARRRAARSTAATARSTSSRSGWSTTGTDRRQVHAAHLRRGAEGSGCSPGSTTRPSTGSSTPATSTSARCGRTTSVPTRLALERTNTEHAPWLRRAQRPQVVPQPGGRPRCCARRCGGWTRPGRGRTSTSRSSAAGWSRRSPASPMAESRDPHRRATRYVAPLREGGSLPGIVEADDLGTYVCKFRGAGQGLKVLVAEVVVGELARPARHPHPRAGALSGSTPAIGRYEADEEVQDLLTASIGLNLGVDFLPGLVRVRRRLLARPGGGRARSCGWTRSPPTSTAAGATRTCWSGTAAVGDRPRRLPVLPPRLVRRASAPPSGSRASPTTPSDHVLAAHRPACPAADAELAPRVDPGPARRGGRPGARTSGSSRCPARRPPTRCARRYVDFLLARVSGERGWLPAAGAA